MTGASTRTAPGRKNPHASHTQDPRGRDATINCQPPPVIAIISGRTKELYLTNETGWVLPTATAATNVAAKSATAAPKDAKATLEICAFELTGNLFPIPSGDA